MSLPQDTWIGALIAAAAAFALTWIFAFIVRFFKAAAEFFYAEKDRADTAEKVLEEIRIQKDASQLEILYCSDNESFVRKAHGNGNSIHRYWVAIKNVSMSHKTIYNVELHTDYGIVSQKVLWVANSCSAPILAKWDRIDPGVTEWVELFGLGTDSAEKLAAVEGWIGTHAFTLEVRATDTPRVAQKFEFDATNPVAVQLV